MASRISIILKPPLPLLPDQLPEYDTLSLPDLPPISYEEVVDAKANNSFISEYQITLTFTVVITNPRAPSYSCGLDPIPLPEAGSDSVPRPPFAVVFFHSHAYFYATLHMHTSVHHTKILNTSPTGNLDFMGTCMEKKNYKGRPGYKATSVPMRSVLGVSIFLSLSLCSGGSTLLCSAIWREQAGGRRAADPDSAERRAKGTHTQPKAANPVPDPA